jgi:hypothetical protein
MGPDIQLMSETCVSIAIYPWTELHTMIYVLMPSDIEPTNHHELLAYQLTILRPWWEWVQAYSSCQKLVHTLQYIPMLYGTCQHNSTGQWTELHTMKYMIQASRFDQNHEILVTSAYSSETWLEVSGQEI